MIPVIDLNQRLEDAGWFAVPRPVVTEAPIDEENEDVWVVFTKRFPYEVVFLRFPEEPEYRYQGERMEVESSQGDTTFFFSAEPVQGAYPPWEKTCIYKENQMWIHEKWIATPHTLYLMKVFSSTPLGGESHMFIDSFRCENTHGKDSKYGFITK